MKTLFSGLAALLRDNHYLHKNGSWVTDYHKIRGLKVLASTTNGTSGIGRYGGVRVYWYFNHKLAAFEIEKITK